jgi:NAD(P)-dependent dehydrogenase (short-subunit alcohol dehydrogenase family)
LANHLRSLGTEAEYFRADIRQDDDVRSLIEFAVDRFGRLDVAVNSAGTEGKPGPLLEQSAENYACTFEANVLGMILSLKHELAIMCVRNGDLRR